MTIHFEGPCSDHPDTKWVPNIGCMGCYNQSHGIYDLVLLGQCPSGKNQVIITRTGKRFPNKRFKDWRELAVAQIKKQLVIKEPWDKPISVIIDYYPGDNRRRDVPGIIDALWHVLEKANIVTDDKHLGGRDHTVVFNQFGVDKDNPRLEISLNVGRAE